MNRNAPIFCFLVVTLAAFCGCSNAPSAKDSKRAKPAPDRIQGKIQVLVEPGSALDAALNAGGASSVYLWEGLHRYRLFLRAPVQVTHGNGYVVEGVYAQKAIDEIGDPDQGKNGYPLESSCRHVVTTAWTGLAFDAIDAQAEVLRARVKRYPARPLFLVTRIRPATDSEIAASKNAKKGAAGGENIAEVSVPAEKQRALLVEGSPVQPAPLWQPEGGTAHCKVVIGPDGTISDLETGAQLCESVHWSQFRYKPTVQRGRPVNVSTEVEVRFEPRK